MAPVKRWKRTEDGVYWPAFVDVLTALLVIMLLFVGNGPSEEINKLRAENAALKKEYVALKARIADLERQIKDLGRPRTSEEFASRRLNLRVQKTAPELQAALNAQVVPLDRGLSVAAQDFRTADLGGPPLSTPDVPTQQRLRSLFSALFSRSLLDKWAGDQEIELVTVRVHAAGALGREARYLNEASEGVVNWLSTEGSQFGLPVSSVGSSVDYTARRPGTASISVRLYFRLSKSASAAAKLDWAEGREP